MRSDRVGLGIVALVIGLGVLVGCKDRGSKSGRQASPSQPSSSGTPAPSSPSASSPFKLTALKSQTLVSGDAPQTVAVDQKITVTVPGGTLKGPATLTISSVQDAPEPLPGCYTRMAAFDVSMGDLHVFEKPIQIDFPVDTAGREDIPADLRFCGAYYDPATRLWVELPTSFDASRRTVRVETQHLSLVELWQVGKDYTLLPCKRFGIFYDLKTVRKETSDYVSEQPDGDPRVPDFIADIRRFANGALDAYSKQGLKPYADPAWILVAPGVSSSYSWNSRRVYITFSSVQPQVVRYNVAHELFHAIQHGSYYSRQAGRGISDAVLGTADHRWWLEASAEYAAARVAIADFPLMGKLSEEKMATDYLARPLSHFGDSKDADSGRLHQYQTAYFIEYLCRRGSAEAPVDYFAKMYKHVAASSGGPLEALDGFLTAEHGKERALAAMYDEYAQHFLFAIASRMPKGGVPERINPAAVVEATLFAETQSQAEPVTLTVPGTHAAKAWAIRAKALGQSQERTFSVSLPGKAIPADTTVYVCKLMGNFRTPTTPQILGVYAAPADAGKVFDAVISPTDGLYVVAVNHSGAEQKVTVKVVEKIAVTIRRPLFEVEKGIIGAEYKFSAIPQAIPENAQYNWSFSDGTTVEGKSVRHKFANAATYDVKLKVAWPGGEASDQIKFTIAPDVKIESDEVTFQVYRIFKNAFGTSKQACGSISVTILKNGQVVDAGEANATGGVFSIRLPVGENYTYRVNYKYTAPPQSGSTTGSFSVTKGGRNFVSVETGTESQ